MGYNLKYTGEQIDELLDKINDLGYASEDTPGMMSAGDKEKLDNIEENAEENVIENVTINGVAGSRTGKTLDFVTDTTPTQGSIKMVTSGGVHAAILSEAQARQQADNTLNGLISGIRSDLANYYLKTETYNKTEVDTLIAAIKQFVPTLVQTLPEPSAQTMFILYLVPSSDPTAGDVKDEYITVMENSQYKWEKIGKTDIDLSAYSTTEQMNAAIAAAVANYTTTDDLLVMLAAKSDKDGYTPSQRVGSADDVVFGERAWSEEEILFRRSGCPYERGNAVVRGAKGRSMAWNQLVTNGDFSQGTTGWGGGLGRSLSVSGGKLICTITGDEIGSMPVRQDLSIIDAHKYLVSTRYTIHAASFRGMVYIGYFGAPTQWWDIITISSAETSVVINEIITASGGHTNINVGPYRRDATQGSFAAGDYTAFDYIRCIDLTLMFGAGKEPSTVAEFERTFPNRYYPYNAGKLIHNAANRIESVGRNVWDEEWEVGTIDITTGLKTPNPNGIRSKNDIAVFPNTAYFYCQPENEGTPRIAFLDKNHETISVIYSGAVNKVFTTPANCHYIRFSSHTSNYGATYNHDICINRSDSRNGLYTPYEKSVATIRFDAFKVKDANGNVLTVNGLKGAGTVFDERDDVRRKANIRVGADKLLDATNASGSNGIFQFRMARKYANGNFNIQCGRYETYTAAHSSSSNIATLAAANDKHLFVNSGSATFYIADSAYSTLEAFLAAAGDMEITYELATPVEYDLVDDINGYYKATSLGTEASAPLTDATGNPISLPFTGELGYGQNIGEQMDDKTGQNDYAPALVAGSADGLLGVSKAQEFTFAAVPEGTGNGAARIGKVKGNSLAWNQLVKSAFSSVTRNSVTISADETEHCVVFSGTPTGGSYWWTDNAIGNIIVVGHKYLYSHEILALASGLSGAVFGMLSQAPPKSSATKFSTIFSATSTTGAIGITSGVSSDPYPDFTGTKVIYRLIDLTLMFGAGKEPSTVAEFEALYNEPYYPQNNGEIINNAADTLVSDGFNQWDEEAQVGNLSTTDGSEITDTMNIRSGYMPAIPGAAYYVNSSKTLRFWWYDSNKSSVSGGTATVGSTQVAPSNARYFRFGTTNAYGTTYNNDICINRSDPARNGKYEHHWRRTLPLALTSLRGRLNGTGERVAIFPDGMKRAGDAYDEVYGNIAIKRISTVNLGDLTWTYDSERARFYSTVVTNAKAASSNILCTKYVANANGADKTVFIGNNGRIYLVDSAYSDAATFVAAMNGVMLNYELATPEIYILDEPIPSGFAVGAGGTMRALPDAIDGTPTAPFSAEIAFPRDNYGITSKNSTVALLEALKTAGKIASYTIVYDANGDMTFNIT